MRNHEMTTANNVTPLVSKKKIDIAREHFNRITAEDYVPTEGSTPRGDFLAICVNELAMTESGASTYWQNLRNQKNNKGLYSGNKAPTGAPRGRRPDVAGRVRKAAARVERLQNKVADDLKALNEAQNELVAMSTAAAAG